MAQQIKRDEAEAADGVHIRSRSRSKRRSEGRRWRGGKLGGNSKHHLMLMLVFITYFKNKQKGGGKKHKKLKHDVLNKETEGRSP